MATAAPGSNTSRSVNVFALASGQCAPDLKAERLSWEFKSGNPETVSTTPVPIAATGRFDLVARYGDSGFARNRGCVVQANFQPVPDRKYKGVVIIRGDVASCDFALYDITSGKEEITQFEMPSTVCTGEGPRPNGQAVRTLWVPVPVPIR